MKFTVNVFGRKFRYDMTLEELIRTHAETIFGYTENSFLDGHIEKMPTATEFVEDVYDNVVNGYNCSIALDGTEIEIVFPDEVRFIGSEKIKAIIKEAYWVEEIDTEV